MGHDLENISTALLEWKRKLSHAVGEVDDDLLADIPTETQFDIKFVGYVAQQYIQKTTSGGEKRAVAAYESIMTRIPSTIQTHFIEKLQPALDEIDYQIGAIPNLYSLIPLSQTAHKPIFTLRAKDGVRGAHFNKVRAANSIFESVTTRLLQNLGELA